MESSANTQRITLWVIAAVQFLTPFMFSAIGVALPAIGREFKASGVQLGLIEMVYILGVALLLLPIGRFADIYGRKRVFFTGVVVITVATLALAMAPTVSLLILFRFVQGVGAAMITSTSFAILTSVYPAKERGKAMGIVVACVYLGISAGPTLAGLMIDFLGWRWIFYASVPIELAILVFALLHLKGEWADSRGETFDRVGSLIYIIGLGGLIIGLLAAQQLHYASWFAVGGAVMMVLFLYYESSIPYPILPLQKIVANRVFAFSNIATWLNYAASFGIMFFFSIYLQVVKGIPPKTTGFILITQPLLQAVCAPLAGSLADRYRPAPIATWGMGLCTLGMLLSAFISPHSGFPYIYLILTVMGLGFGFFSTPNTTAIMASVERRDYGMASSMIATMRTTGMLTAMTLITVLLSHYLGEQQITTHTIPGFMATMHTAMLIFTALGVLGIFCSLGRTSQDH